MSEGGTNDQQRITPAWAGKSLLMYAALLKYRDHPRVGGEKRFCLILHSLCGGSPPRGRGKVDEATYEQKPTRITPAWAGKSKVRLLCKFS